MKIRTERLTGERLVANIEGRWGRFVPSMVRVETDDGRTFRLLESFRYEDPDKLVWDAPAGKRVNGASIPRVLWRVLPPFGAWWRASVIHDVGCEDRTHPSWQVHRTFYFACRAGGCSPVTAWVLWFAVRCFGPRFCGSES